MHDHVKGGALTEVAFFVLLAVYQPRHGYGIMQFIRDHTGGRLMLGAGTLYGALTTLAEKGWIEPCGDTSDRRKQYRITPQGKETVQQELQRLKSVTATAEIVIGGHRHD
jgi:DNA-binding PadR family transcriptional regulator